jgi:hypothetical protein
MVKRAFLPAAGQQGGADHKRSKAMPEGRITDAA